VSRAIRNSAKESFIRLLTIDNLDTILPTELERLESLRAMTQAKYRFLVHRRTMLFQALNSTTLGQQKDGEDGVSVVSRLSTQLAETVAECDQRLEEVLKLNDQTAQINKLLDIHWASALSIALRKVCRNARDNYSFSLPFAAQWELRSSNQGSSFGQRTNISSGSRAGGRLEGS